MGPGMVYGSEDKARSREHYRGKQYNLNNNVGGCGGEVAKSQSGMSLRIGVSRILTK